MRNGQREGIGEVKICFYNVTASFIPGGLETYCWEAGRALARRGHAVTIVAGDDGHGVTAASKRAADRKSTRLNSSHSSISYAVFCLKKKNQHTPTSYN